MTRIGFAGLGLMGSRMAPHLGKQNPLTVWNRTAARAEPLRASGATVAATPKELAEKSDVVFTCLADPQAVESTYLGTDGIVAGLRRGMRCVETSTISPELARRIAAACEARGAELLEAPVTGSKIGAEKATLLIMTGGKREVHDELAPLLAQIGSRAIYVGPIGQASAMKLIGNTFISFMLEALGEGLTLGRAMGLDPEKIIEVIQASGFASPYWAFKGGAMSKRDFATHFTIDLMHKDQRLALAEAGAHNVGMPGLAAIHQVTATARAHGWGGEDIAAVVKAVEMLAAAKP
jgi:3-hydroxyisobutyrate dehydrogenase-like beta-hydroxyacid dehydrogenase